MTRRARKPHPFERETVRLPPGVWERIRRPTDAEVRAATHRRRVRALVSGVVLSALCLLTIAVPAALTYAPFPGWVVAGLSAATVGCVTVTAFVVMAWVHRRWS